MELRQLRSVLGQLLQSYRSPHEVEEVRGRATSRPRLFGPARMATNRLLTPTPHAQFDPETMRLEEAKELSVRLRKEVDEARRITSSLAEAHASRSDAETRLDAAKRMAKAEKNRTSLAFRCNRRWRTAKAERVRKKVSETQPLCLRPLSGNFEYLFLLVLRTRRRVICLAIGVQVGFG